MIIYSIALSILIYLHTCIHEYTYILTCILTYIHDCYLSEEDNLLSLGLWRKVAQNSALLGKGIRGTKWVFIKMSFSKGEFTGAVSSSVTPMINNPCSYNTYT